MTTAAALRLPPDGLLPRQDDRCQVMGIVNVTPDSFSDGGDFLAVESAVAHGLQLIRDGADLVDVGGESTRPGAARVGEGEELARVIPVIAALADRKIRVSVDTMRASVAREAVAAGAVMVNDVSAGLADPDMLPLLAELDVACVLMHWRAHSAEMERHAEYTSVVDDVHAELAGRADAAMRAGVRPERIVIDPGLGFAKTAAQCWGLLEGLPALASLGFPLLVGASRKRFLAECVTYGDRDGAEPADRDEASGAVAAYAALSGAWGVRVHSVTPAAAASQVARRLARGSTSVPDLTRQDQRSTAR